MAMEARCYTGDGTATKMNPLKYKKADFAAYVAEVLLLAASIVLRVLKLF